MPAIIFLLLAGVLVGPIFHVVHPEALLGELFHPFVSMSVAIILFEGSLTLKFKEILGLEKVVRNILSVGVLVTWAITAVVTKYAIGISWEFAALFAAITVVTGPTVVAPLLRTVKPSAAVSNILRWEGIVIDPIGASFAVLIYEFVLSGGGSKALGATLIAFSQILLISGGIGVIAGYGFGVVLRKRWLPEFLHNIGVLGVVFTAFVLSNFIQADSGLVAVTVMGMWLANMPGVELDDILEFKEHLSIMLVSFLFIFLTAAIDLNAIKSLGWAAVVVCLAVQFLARPLNIMVSTLGSTLSLSERYILAWIAPKGIVAAAISSLFAIELSHAGIGEADLLVPLTYTVILSTVLLQSFTSRPLAKWLGVAEPDPDGFLIIGTNKIARAIATIMHERGVKVLLVNEGWGKISKARHAGLPTYHGNPLSDPANRYMDLAGIGKMLALSQYANVNATTAKRYQVEFGKENVYVLRSEKGETGRFDGKILFDAKTDFSFLDQMIGKGAKIHVTQLTDVFSFADFMDLQGKNGTLLLAIDKNDAFRPFHVDRQWEPEAGWSIIYLNHQLF